MKHPPIKQQVEAAVAAAAERGWTEPDDFPAEVHQSLQLLFKERPKRREDIRWATPDEMALAQLQRNPRRCTAWSLRTGLPCRNKPVFPGVVCCIHGAQMKHVKESNDRKLAQISNVMVREMIELATIKTRNPKMAIVKQKAIADLLDRASVGAVVESKVRSSYRNAGQGDVTVQIGFLRAPGELSHGHEQNEPILDAEIATERAALPAADSGTGAGDQDADDRHGDAR